MTLPIVAGLDALTGQFDAQLTLAGPPAREEAIHFCLALGFQAALSPPMGTLILERRIEGWRIDLWVDTLGLAIEGKYYRPIPSGKNLPDPQLFGDFLADFNKLAQVEARERLVVYVSNEQGIGYIERNGNDILPLVLHGRSMILAQHFNDVSATVRSKALEHGPWIPQSCELVWRKTAQSWHLLAWKTAPLY